MCKQNISDTCRGLDATKIGIRVECAKCKRTKAPRGRSIPLHMWGAYCDGGCGGYNSDPQVGDLWPGESEASFGYPCRDASTNKAIEEVG